MSLRKAENSESEAEVRSADTYAERQLMFLYEKALLPRPPPWTQTDHFVALARLSRRCRVPVTLARKARAK